MLENQPVDNIANSIRHISFHFITLGAGNDASTLWESGHTGVWPRVLEQSRSSREL
jgi:hypothetical protein